MDIQNKMIHALIDSVDTVSVYFEKNIEEKEHQNQTQIRQGCWNYRTVNLKQL